MRSRDKDGEFKAFYDAEGARVRELALFLVGDRELAADLAQEAFLRAYGRWNRIRKSDPGPYVRRALVNLCKNAYRRRSMERKQWARPATAGAVEPPNLEESLRVAEALKALPPFRRAAIVLRYYEDLSDEQIAVTLDRPLGTVKSDIRRGLQSLGPLLQEGARGRG
ncbi:MAG TPA: SigE family RNA polymerase sigma factor [Actinomycetota bacterium]|nr:SigE family RNA polymerase sigma factor [Actinomycetota bacterium]